MVKALSMGSKGLHHVLQHIGAAQTVEDIKALLPWNTDLKRMQ